MAKNTAVNSADVRTWGRENTDLIRTHAETFLAEGETLTDEGFAPMVKCLGESARGRLNPVVVSAFEAHNRNRTHVEKHANVSGKDKPVEQPYRSLDKRGRNITRKWKGTVAEARVLSGQGPKGRLNMKALTEALEKEWREAQPVEA